MNTPAYLLLTVVFAGMLQSGFLLGTSMLTLLSGHHFGRGRSHARLVRLGGSFTIGSLAQTFLILATLTYVCLIFDLHHNNLVMLLSGASTVLAGVWYLFFYYRPGRGTALWIPRSFARYLGERTARTRSSSESFVLGAASVLYELPFTIGLLATAALQIALLPAGIGIGGIASYAGLATLSLFVFFILIGGGHTGSELTRWRVSHKRFLQVLVGLGLVILGICVSMNSLLTVLMAHGIMP